MGFACFTLHGKTTNSSISLSLHPSQLWSSPPGDRVSKQPQTHVQITLVLISSSSCLCLLNDKDYRCQSPGLVTISVKCSSCPCVQAHQNLLFLFYIMFKNNSALFWMVEFKIQCDFRWLQSLTPEFWLPSESQDEPTHLKKLNLNAWKSAMQQPGLHFHSLTSK